jgi:hypothetical protein
MTELSTSGFIDENAVHWAIEPFIPIETPDLINHLISRDELAASSAERFRESCESMENLLYQRTGSYHTQFSQLYAAVDPDFDGKVPDGCAAPDTEANAQTLMQLCEEILFAAAYRKVEQDEVERCVGVASQFGVRLHVDFELFKHLAVYARGDVVGTKLRRRLRRLYQPESVDIPIYQRMVVLFQLHEDVVAGEELRASALHLRMFKNIPRQDVDMLLPGARVRLSKIDRAKIIVPSLGGFLLSLRKLAQFFLIFAAVTLYSTAVLVGLIFVAIGYVVKSVLSYFHTKDKHLLTLTRNLYFQKLDTNAGVAYRMIQQAHRQTSVECLLAFYGILAHDGPISTRRLRRKSERILREAAHIEVAFQIDRALERLEEMNLVEQTANGDWRGKEG